MTQASYNIIIILFRPIVWLALRSMHQLGFIDLLLVDKEQTLRRSLRIWTTRFVIFEIYYEIVIKLKGEIHPINLWDILHLCSIYVLFVHIPQLGYIMSLCSFTSTIVIIKNTGLAVYCFSFIVQFSFVINKRQVAICKPFGHVTKFSSWDWSNFKSHDQKVCKTSRFANASSNC